MGPDQVFDSQTVVFAGDPATPPSALFDRLAAWLRTEEHRSSIENVVFAWIDGDCPTITAYYVRQE